MNAEFSHAVFTFLYGYGAGVLSVVLLGFWVKYRPKAASAAPTVVDENTAIRCGACMSFIQSKPIFVNVASPKSFKVYKCEQCSTEVSIEF